MLLKAFLIHLKVFLMFRRLFFTLRLQMWENTAWICQLGLWISRIRGQD